MKEEIYDMFLNNKSTNALESFSKMSRGQSKNDLIDSLLFTLASQGRKSDVLTILNNISDVTYKDETLKYVVEPLKYWLIEQKSTEILNGLSKVISLIKDPYIKNNFADSLVGVLASNGRIDELLVIMNNISDITYKDETLKYVADSIIHARQNNKNEVENSIDASINNDRILSELAISLFRGNNSDKALSLALYIRDKDYQEITLTGFMNSADSLEMLGGNRVVQKIEELVKKQGNIKTFENLFAAKNFISDKKINNLKNQQQDVYDNDTKKFEKAADLARKNANRFKKLILKGNVLKENDKTLPIEERYSLSGSSNHVLGAHPSDVVAVGMATAVVAKGIVKKLTNKNGDDNSKKSR